MIATICFVLAALGLLAMAAKYGLGPVPVDYHASIIAADGEITPGVRKVLLALYRVMGAAMGTAGLLTLVLALGPVRTGQTWAALAIFVAGALVAVTGAWVPYRVERDTGVRTPWRLAAVAGLLLAAGLVAALV